MPRLFARTSERLLACLSYDPPYLVYASSVTRRKLDYGRCNAIRRDAKLSSQMLKRCRQEIAIASARHVGIVDRLGDLQLDSRPPAPIDRNARDSWGRDGAVALNSMPRARRAVVDRSARDLPAMRIEWQWTSTPRRTWRHPVQYKSFLAPRATVHASRLREMTDVSTWVAEQRATTSLRRIGVLHDLA
jgi:hypothetical protein